MQGNNGMVHTFAGISTFVFDRFFERKAYGLK